MKVLVSISKLTNLTLTRREYLLILLSAPTFLDLNGNSVQSPPVHNQTFSFQVLGGTSLLSANNQHSCHSNSLQHFPAETYYPNFTQQIPQLPGPSEPFNSLGLLGEHSHTGQIQSDTASMRFPGLHDSQQGIGTQLGFSIVPDSINEYSNGYSPPLPLDFSECPFSSFPLPDSMTEDIDSLSQTVPLASQAPCLLQTPSFTPRSVILRQLPLHNNLSIAPLADSATDVSMANMIDHSGGDNTGGFNEYLSSGTGTTGFTIPSSSFRVWGLRLAAVNMGPSEQESCIFGRESVDKFSKGDQSVLADEENNSKHQEGTQRTIATRDTLENMLHQLHQPVQTPQIDAPAKPFGPSRSFSIPPARRGGIKRPLSVEELEGRKKARMQGVCIRCRQLKSKV